MPLTETQLAEILIEIEAALREPQVEPSKASADLAAMPVVLMDAPVVAQSRPLRVVAR